MEEAESPMYTSDSFIPFPSEQDKEMLFRLNKESHLNTKNRAANSPRKNSQSSDSSYIPWKRNPYSCGIIGLHEEINDFFEKMRPTEQEEEIRLRVVEHITKIVHSLWALARVEIFGSFRTGLYLPSSDIDMVIIGEWRSLPLSTLSEALQQNGISENDITVIANATVPIVRFVHTPAKVKIDISFNKANGVQSAKLIKKLMKDHPALPKLVIVLKQFLVQRGLNEVYNGGMSSYCLTLLIVSLLQGYHKPKTVPSSNLGTLLLEFFEHYGVNFNYERVSIHFPAATGGMYQPKYRADGLLSVEDPLVKGLDVAKGTYLMHALRQAFENAFLILHKAVTDSAAEERPLNSYLSLIVQVDEKLWEKRIWMTQNYSSIHKRLSDLISKDKEAENTSSYKKNVKKKEQREPDYISSYKKNFKKKQQR